VKGSEDEKGQKTFECEAKLSEVNGNSLTGSSWPCGGLLKRAAEKEQIHC